jgi:hypothetical protein
VLEITIRMSKLEIWGTIFDKCFQTMAYANVMVICEEDYKMLNKYLHHWSENKKDAIRNKRKKYKIHESIVKA